MEVFRDTIFEWDFFREIRMDLSFKGFESITSFYPAKNSIDYCYLEWAHPFKKLKISSLLIKFRLEKKTIDNLTI
ncbi:hypothetical protein BpHYR1_003311 [Brachionus plicatilis]|uniref:Uncharacterized protein n=1 Tax=Brachionus plicatilis TaxID=10195 RepID=A0A3M7Q560_BRAPC|nr:hypothetical protein BpHYR1_003311 [Brachionus plicatilis]